MSAPLPADSTAARDTLDSAGSSGTGVATDAGASPAPTLGSSPSTQLLSSTLTIQFSQSALAATPPLTTQASYMRAHVELYRGDDSSAPAGATAASAAQASRGGGGASAFVTRSELRAAFSVFDTNNTGSISVSEFGVVLKLLGQSVSDTELSELIAELDGDGEISFEEYSDLMMRRAAEMGAAGMGGGGRDDPLDDALSVFDSNPGFARMDLKELQHICTLLKENLSEEEMDTVVKELQPDAEGVIDFKLLCLRMMPGGGNY